MPLTAPSPHTSPTADAATIRELLEQHRAARVDQIKACTFANPVSDATEPALRRRVLDAARLTLDEIDLALARLEAGSFGGCVGCSRRIAVERLYAVPYARFCEGCAGAGGGGVLARDSSPDGQDD